MRLKSTIENSEVCEEVEELAKDKFGDSFREAFYEHGQWWVSVDDGALDIKNYSVVTCAHGCGYGKTDLDFEEV